MRIEFKRIELRNFMSFVEESFDFSSCKGMNLVQGKNNDIPGSKNGSGKSNVWASLLYVLFGQLQSKIKNENIVNKYSKDKDMDLVLHLEVDMKDYKICRGLTKGKASYLEIFAIEDGNEIDITKSTIPETQNFLEKDILHCDITMFLRTILLTADQTYNFYMLKKADKKEFVEKMFDISIFEDMHQAIHKDVLASDKESNACQNRLLVLNKTNDDYASRKEKHDLSQQAKIKVISESIESLKSKLDSAKSIEVKSNADSIKKLECAIEKITVENEKLQEQYEKSFDSMNELKSKDSKLELGLCKFEDSKKSKQQAIDKNKDILGKLCNDCRPIFMKHYSLDVLSKEISDIDSKIAILRKTKLDVEGKLLNCKKNIDSLKSNLQATKDKSTKAREKMKLLVEESMQTSKVVSKIESELNDANNNLENVKNAVNPYIELIDKCKNDIENETKSLSNLELKLRYLKFAESIVSQDTLRKFIIKDLIILLNNKIKTYLTKLGAKYYVEFDENMDYEFIIPGGSCEWSNFSAGERMRIMIATSFAFRDFMSIRNGLNSNILVLDEYFDSAIDSLCVESILNLLKDFSTQQKQNIFVISHRPEVNPESFDRTILVEKTNNISKIEICQLK